MVSDQLNKYINAGYWKAQYMPLSSGQCLARIAARLFLKLSSPRIQVGHVHLGALSGGLVKDGTSVMSSPGRGVEMQRDSHLGATGVSDSVKTQFVGHVSNLLFGKSGLSDDLHGPVGAILVPLLILVVALAGPVVESLAESSLENLHDAVSVSMVVNTRSLARVPHQKQKVGLVVDVVNAVSGVTSRRLFQSVLLPLLFD